MERLSPYQEGVLLWLLDRYRAVEARGKTVDGWGVRIARTPGGTSRSESAADSRALLGWRLAGSSCVATTSPVTSTAAMSRSGTTSTERPASC
jgi:hypothetical protein